MSTASSHDLHFFGRTPKKPPAKKAAALVEAEVGDPPFSIPKVFGRKEPFFKKSSKKNIQKKQETCKSMLPAFDFFRQK
ncbi:MAG: hypothetical protein IKD31_07190 [Clostridia bacterium]|nr:hypothetical protein [Clostridia bacterium]